MIKKLPFDINYIDLHSVHGTNSVLCTLVLNNGRVVVGEAHDEINSTAGAAKARVNAENKRVIVQAFADALTEHKANNG